MSLDPDQAEELLIRANARADTLASALRRCVTAMETDVEPYRYWAAVEGAKAALKANATHS